MNTHQIDGQTVKTCSIYKLLKDIYKDIDYYDTQDFKYNRWSIFKMFVKICRSKILVYLPAQNNLSYIFPVVYILSLIFRFKIHYFVVGGWLNEFLQNKPIHRYCLKRISGIHSETLQLKKDLEESYNFSNVDIFTNFRSWDFKPTVNKFTGKLNLVFMARINKMKGLDMIFSLGDYIEAKGLNEKISIHFYGPIYEPDKTYFYEHIAQYSFMEYCDVLPPKHIYETLTKYDVMLFPTHYYTEGLPGSVVDAYISGIPVIATKWKHATEFVDDGKSGFIIPFNNGQNILNELIYSIYCNPERLLYMKQYAIEKSLEFSVERAKNTIQAILK